MKERRHRWPAFSLPLNGTKEWACVASGAGPTQPHSPQSLRLPCVRLPCCHLSFQLFLSFSRLSPLFFLPPLEPSLLSVPYPSHSFSFQFLSPSPFLSVPVTLPPSQCWPRPCAHGTRGRAGPRLQDPDGEGIAGEEGRRRRREKRQRSPWQLSHTYFRTFESLAQGCGHCRGRHPHPKCNCHLPRRHC